MNKRTEALKRLLVFSMALPILLMGACNAVEKQRNEDLSGYWRETQNYPDTGRIRFDYVNGLWQGSYVKVGTLQAERYGFQVGETVVRGKLKGNVFIGAVLLRYPIETRKICPNLAVDTWVDVRLRVSPRVSELAGSWPQTTLIEETCEERETGSQSYSLIRAEEEP